MAKHIVKHPGGVILHHKDGSSEYYGYGAEVDPSELADYQRDNLGDYTDDKDRSAYTRNQQETDAHRNAAFADGGQVNSTSDPVPGNYGELSEEDAAQLVMSIRDPQIQARLLLHERMHHGARQMVVDGASPLAVALSETLYKNASNDLVRFDQTPVVDRERQVERESRRAEQSGGSDELSDKLSREDLDARASAAGVSEPEKLQNKGAVIAAIREAEAASPTSGTGQTPAPQSG